MQLINIDWTEAIFFDTNVSGNSMLIIGSDITALIERRQHYDSR